MAVFIVAEETLNIMYVLAASATTLDALE